MKEYLMIGQILKPQGTRGEVKVKPETDDPMRFMEMKKAYLDEKGEKAIEITGAREREGYVYLSIQGISSMNEAEVLRGKQLFIDRANAVKLPEGRYFIVDLIGLKVLDSAGEELGRLKDVSQAGGNDVYTVSGGRSFMFPALKTVIQRIDIEEGIMVLDEERLKEVAVYDDD